MNLDMAASTPAMEAVADAVIEFLPWYSSVHRGAGFASQVSTRAYEAAREAVGTFVGARSTDTVVFVRNTTEALNLLTHCLVLRPGRGDRGRTVHVVRGQCDHGGRGHQTKRGEVGDCPLPRRLLI